MSLSTKGRQQHALVPLFRYSLLLAMIFFGGRFLLGRQQQNILRSSCKFARYFWQRGKQWQTTPKNLPRMQRTRALPVAWLSSGLCPNRPKGWIPLIIIIFDRFEPNSDFFRQISGKKSPVKNFTKTRTVGVALIQWDLQTDGQTWSWLVIFAA